jgi:hypothetical protein
MNMKHEVERATLIFVLSTIVMLSACHKAQWPAVPPPAAPTASLTATPQVIEKGQGITLAWETANVNDISIDAEGFRTETLGLLQPKGSMQVTPSDSTTYILYAKGARRKGISFGASHR